MKHRKDEPVGRSPSPEQIRKAVALRGQRHREMLEDYTELTQEFGLKDKEAAQRLGVTLRTVQRYKRQLATGVYPSANGRKRES